MADFFNACRLRVLATLAALLLLSMAAAMPALAAAPGPARAGVLELSRLPAAPVALEGEWALVRGSFLDPSSGAQPDTFVAVPSPWNDTGGAHGHGTYTLQVNCPAGEVLALSVPAQRSAMRLYANGALVVQQGEPGPTAELARAAVGARAVVTAPLACPLSLVVHVSNFNHRQGGMVRAIVAGDRAVLVQDARGQLVYSTLLLGGYLVLALLSLIFFAARRKDPTPLWFGLFCVAQAVFTDMMSERTILLAFAREVPWETYLRIEYAAWYLNMGVFLVLVYRLFPVEMRWPVVRAGLAAIGLATLAVLVLPARLSSHIVPAGQVMCVVMGLYITGAVAVAARRRGSDAAVMLAGLAFLLVVVVVDAALYSAGYWLRTVTPLGLLAFALAPGIVMARRLARALNAEELRALEQKVRGDLLVRTTQAGIFDWDTTRGLRGYSPRLQAMLGDPPQIVDGAGPMFHEFVHPQDRERVHRQFESALSDHGTRSGEMRHPPSEYRLLRADGSAVWVAAEAISLTGSDGAALRFICSFIDISSRRAMEERLEASRDQVAAQAGQLQRQNAQLERDARLREDVERMSRHDLKTPLNSLIGVVRLLRDEGAVPPGAHDLLGIAERAGLRMLEMVNLSLDLFRMEQGTYAFRPQAVDLAAVVARVQVDLRSLAEGSGVAIDVDTAIMGPPARGEELLCYAIVANLVKNAVEATPTGGRVRIAFRPGEAVRLRIHNPGDLPPGVDAVFFDKYFSGGKPGGTGLGTYSARLMARVQQGELVLEAGAGQGVALVLSLQPAEAALAPATGPAPAPAQAPASVHADPRLVTPAPPPPTLLAGRVLVVDDDEYNRLMLQRCLPGPPLVVDTAIHGRAALEAARRHWPDVVLIDMEMPVMGGLEATRALRAHQAAHALAECTVVMMSSNDEEAAATQALEAGADHFLAKPVARETLLGVLRALLPQAPVSGAEGDGHAAAPAVVPVDAELIEEVPAFLETRAALLQAMGAALAGGDRGELARLAHQCGGGFAMWGFDWAARQCRRIEDGAPAMPAETVRHVLAAVELHVAQVRVRAEAGDAA